MYDGKVPINPLSTVTANRFLSGTSLPESYTACVGPRTVAQLAGHEGAHDGLAWRPGVSFGDGWLKVMENTKEGYYPESAVLPTALRRHLSDCISPGDTVLDVGCGNGRFMATARTLGARAMGVEPDLKLCSIANRIGPTTIGVVEALPFDDETFDVLICSMVLMLVEGLPVAVSELSRCLKKNGSLILVILHPAADEKGQIRGSAAVDVAVWTFKNWVGFPIHSTIYYGRDFEQYIRLLTTYFSIRDYEEVDSFAYARRSIPYLRHEFVILRLVHRLYGLHR